MKKRVLFSILMIGILLLVSGCSSSSPNMKVQKERVKKCTHEEVDDGLKEVDTVVITYKGNKVLKVSVTNVSEIKNDETTKALMLSFGQTLAERMSEVNGIEMTFELDGENSMKSVTTIDYTKLNSKDAKRVLGELYEVDDDYDEDELYDIKDMTVNEFIDENFDDYICK